MFKKIIDFSDKNFFDRLYVFTLFLVSITLIATWLEIANPSKFAKTISTNMFFFCDFARYYVNAIILSSGHGFEIYNPSFQDNIYKTLIPDMKPFDRFIDYPPYTGVLFLPLLLFSFGNAYLVFVVFSLLAFYFLINTFRKQFNNISNLAFLGFSLGVFVSTPMVYNIFLGQLNLILFASVGLFFISLLKSNSLKYLLPQIVFLFKPHYYTYFFPLMLLSGKFKNIIFYAIVMLFLLAVSIKFCGWENTINYPKIIYNITFNYHHNSFSMEIYRQQIKFFVSLRYLFDIIFPQFISNAVTLVFYAAGIFLSCAMFFKRNSNNSENIAWMVSSIITLFVVVSPHCFTHDLLILVIPALITIKNWNLGQIIKLDFEYRLWCLIFYFFPVWSWILSLVKIGPNSYDCREFGHLFVDLVLFIIAFRMFLKTRK